MDGVGPSLIPEDPAERALMMGLSHEIAGEHGIGWSGRLMIVRGPIEEGPSSPAYGFAKFFGDQYRYSKPAGDQAEKRSIDVVSMLSSRIEEQQAAGKRYLIGDALTAVDIYWAAFATLIVPLPQEECPMTPDIRAMYESTPEPVKAAASPALLAHRDFICETALGLPFEF